MATKAAPTSSKRRSTLAELGIKPGTEAATGATPPKTPTTATTAAAARRASVVRPSKTPATTTRSRPQSMVATTAAAGATSSTRASKTPGVQRSASMSRSGSQPSPAARKAAPAAINTARKPLSSSGNVNVASPTTPTPAAAKRRSMNASAAAVAGTATPPSSPLVTRRGSKVQRTPSSGNSSSSTSSSTATTSALEEQVKSLKDQLAQQRQLLDDKDHIVQELQAKLTQLEKRPETPVLSSSSMLIPCDLSVDSATEKRKDEDGDVSEKRKEEEEEIRRQVKEELTKSHQEDMDRLLQEQERRLQSEIQIQQSEHDKKYESLVQEHHKQREALVQDYEKKIADLLHEHEQTAIAAGQKKHDLEQKIEELEKTLNDSRQVAHLRKIEQQLADKSAAFEEFKQQAQQATDQLERRFRGEMQQLQSGSEDGAKVWLDKHRAAQQEIDRLHGLLRELENKTSQERHELELLHEQQLEEWKEKCEAHEMELDSQAHQTSALLQQVEDLQNSLEAATERLETAQKESSSSKTNTLPPSPDPAAVAAAAAAVVDHKACEQALDELQRRMTSLKDAHETQLNRLGHEKARELQALRAEMLELQTILQQTKTVMEERIRTMAEQHSKEIKLLHQQYQKQADMKDKDLEQYAYRVKALTTAKQKEMDMLRKETMEKMEHTVEGYETRIRQFEEQLKDSQKTIHAHRDENAQLERLIHQLQAEIHPGGV